jgi:ATP-binding cassette subfamily C (CFTR/MRP) protein 1
LQKPARAKKESTEFQMMGDGETESHAAPNSRFEGRGEGDASWWSQMLFNWMTPLLVLGRQMQLNDSDLLPLLEEDTCYAAGVRLNKEWQAVLSRKNEKEPTLFRALYQCFGWSFAAAGVWKVVNDVVVFVGPLMLQSLIRYVEQPDADKSIMDGALLAIGIFAAKTTETIALGQYFQVGFRIGGQVRASITHLVYRKAFMLSSRGRQQYKLGEMVSLMSVDATRLCGVVPYLHQFWSAPVQLFISVGLLYNIVGASVFAGMILMVLLIPANTWIAQKQTKLNRQIMKIKDEVRTSQHSFLVS